MSDLVTCPLCGAVPVILNYDRCDDCWLEHDEHLEGEAADREYDDWAGK